jgi:hypothetical protein
MGKNRVQRGRQQGPQDHAVGEHGPVTRLAIRLRVCSRGASDEAAERKHEHYDPERIRAHKKEGGDRLFEHRKQHDEAEENSEKTRLARDIDRHKHGPRDRWSRASREARAKRKS